MKYTMRIWISLMTFLVIISSNLYAQQIYPVQLNGVLIPPYSMLLSDYANARSQDLMFNATLNDPIEASRQVYFRITVKHNGRDIMQTDPNFSAPPMTLSQFSPEMITGSELAMYLQARNFVGQNRNNSSNALPDGFNQICLEVMDFQRKVPISRQICAGGLFRLFEPPLVTLPASRQEVKPLPGQNIMFKWLPRHIGLPNAPNMVEYEFKLVELLPGIGNPNDAFERSIPIYQLTTMMPTVIYSEAQPILQEGKNYAWRVQAKEVMGGNVFQNKGFSAITTFTYGKTPRRDRSIPQGCTTSSVIASLVNPPRSSENGTLRITDVVKLGFFDLEIDEISGSSNSYSGKGGIHVPFLKAYLKVEFSGLRINKQKEAYSLGQMTVVKDVPFGFTEQQLRPSQIGNILTDPFLNQLNNFINSASGANRRVSTRNSSNKTRIGLPLILDQKDSQGKDLPAVVLLDMKFTLRRGEMTAIAFQSADNNKWISYAGSVIPITPKGVKKDASLTLIHSQEIAQSDGSKLFFNGKDKGSGLYTKALCNCKGIDEFEINGSYQFSQNTLKPADGNSKNIETSIKGKGESLHDFIAETGKIPSFQLPKLVGHTFETGKGTFDYSSTEKMAKAKLPTALEKVDKSWKGFTFETAKETVPTSLDFTGNQQKFALKEGSLAITSTGVISELSKQKIIDITQGKIGNWPFGIDKLTVYVSGSQLDSSILKGKIKVPIIDEPFDYSGKLIKSANTGDFDIIIKAPKGKGTMSCWNGSLEYDSKTLVKAVSRRLQGNQKYIPYADLQGKFSLKFDGKTFRKYLDGNKDSKLTRLKRALGVQDPVDFEIERLDFEGLIIDPSLPAKQRYVLKSYNKKSPLVHVGGTTFPMTSAEVLFEPKTSDGHTEIGLKIILNSFDKQKIEAVVLGIENQTAITVWARKDANGNFKLNRIETDTKFIDCDCL